MPDLTIDPAKKGQYLKGQEQPDFNQLSPAEQERLLEPDPFSAKGFYPEAKAALIKSIPYDVSALMTLFVPPGAPAWWGVPAAVALSAAGGFGGEGLRQEIYKAQGSPAAPRTGAEELERMRQMAEETGAAELGGRIVGGLFPSPMRMYRSAVRKPPGVMTETDLVPIYESGIKYKILPTQGGMDRAMRLADNWDQQISQTIAATPKRTRTYIKNLQDRMDRLRATWGKTGTHAVDNRAIIDNAERDVLAEHGGILPVRNNQGGYLRPRGPLGPNDTLMSLPQLRQRAKFMDLSTMQQVKKNQWAQIRAKTNPRGGGTTPGWATSTNPDLELLADEEVGRMFRDEIGKAYPGIHRLNELEGHMFELQRGIDRQLANEGGRRLIPWLFTLGLMEAGRDVGKFTTGHEGVGTLIGGAAGLVPTLFKGSLENPELKAGLGIGGQMLPGQARRELVPGAVRGAEYYMEAPYTTPGGTQEIDPSQVQPRAATTGAPATQAATFGLPERVPEPPAPPAAPPPYQDPSVPPAQRSVLERQKSLQDDPLYGWKDDWQRMMVNASVKRSVPLGLLQSIAQQEGSYTYAQKNNIQDPNKVVSSGNARGLMQVVPSTGKQYGYSAEDLADPDKNIDAAAQYLSFLNSKYPGRPELVLAAYKIGQGDLARHNNDITSLDPGSQRYVYRGMATWARLSSSPEEAERYIKSLPQNAQDYINY